VRANGVSGWAVELNGYSDYVDVADADILDITGDITMVAWVKPYTMAEVGPIIVKGHGMYDYSYYLALGRIYDNGANLQLQAEKDGHIWFNSGEPLSLNRWHQIVGVRGGDSAAIYVDGVKCWSGPCFASPLRVNDLSLRFGSHYEHAFLFHGAIDEVCIFNRALAPAEIHYLYEHPSGCSCNYANLDHQSPVDSGAF
jgi:MSHA biogenesis protein MshQ